MNVSVLVPYRADDGPRDALWKFTRQRLKGVLPAAEIVVSDDRRENDELFNRPQALNLAAARATGDLYLIADADTTIDSPLLLREALQATREDRKWRLPVRYQQLTQTASEALQEDDLSDRARIVVDTDDVEWEGRSWSGIVIIPAAAYHQVGGGDERYIGWGADDAALGLALDAVYGPHVRFPAAAVHLWHERDEQNKGWHRNSIEERVLTERYMAAADNRAAMLALLTEKP